MSTFASSFRVEETIYLHDPSADTMPPGTGWPQRLPWLGRNLPFSQLGEQRQCLHVWKPCT